MLRAIYAVAVLVLLLLWGLPCGAIEDAAGANRYAKHEMSNGSYGKYEVLPGRSSPFSPFVQRGRQKQGRTGTGGATFQADAHAMVPNYGYQRCVSCHTTQARNNRHVTRVNIACSQCHGKETVAGIRHYYSPLNPIRRHAYVCAKCHQGASGSFAMYKVHEPSPAMASTAGSFPVLYWAFWIMIAIAVGSFGLFLPHTGMWIVREFFTREKGGGDQ